MKEMRFSASVQRRLHIEGVLYDLHSAQLMVPLCMQAKKVSKPKKVVHRLDSDAGDISMDDDSGDSDFGAPKKVPLCLSLTVALVACQPLTYIAVTCQKSKCFLKQDLMHDTAHLPGCAMSIAQHTCRQGRLRRSRLPKLQRLPRQWPQLGESWRHRLPRRSAHLPPGEIMSLDCLQRGPVRSVLLLCMCVTVLSKAASKKQMPCVIPVSGQKGAWPASVSHWDMDRLRLTASPRSMQRRCSGAQEARAEGQSRTEQRRRDRAQRQRQRSAGLPAGSGCSARARAQPHGAAGRWADSECSCRLCVGLQLSHLEART